MDNTRKRRLIEATSLFGIFAVLYFLAASIDMFPTDFNWFKAVPLTVLAVFSVVLLPWQMSAAMFFAAAGDLFGEMKYTSFGADTDIFFVLQMASFALGHVMIVWWLLSLIWAQNKPVKTGKKSKKAAKQRRGSSYALLAMLPPVAVVYAGSRWIVPHVSSPLCWGIVAYMCIIAVMWWSALLQKDLLYIVGATLFVCSDFILAWNMFVCKLPASTWLIMVPYFLAELFLFLRSAGVIVPKQKTAEA